MPRQRKSNMFYEWAVVTLDRQREVETAASAIAALHAMLAAKSQPR